MSWDNDSLTKYVFDGSNEDIRLPQSFVFVHGSHLPYYACVNTCIHTATRKAGGGLGAGHSCEPPFLLLFIFLRSSVFESTAVVPATLLVSMLVWFVNLLHECSPADGKPRNAINPPTQRNRTSTTRRPPKPHIGILIHDAPIAYYRHRSYRQDDNQSGGGRGSFGGSRVGGDPFGTNIRRVYIDQDGELVFERAGEEEKRGQGDRADGDVAKSLSKSFELFPALVRRRKKREMAPRLLCCPCGGVKSVGLWQL